MKKIKISAVSYANTYPFLLGLEDFLKGDDFEIIRDVPSTCATKLINNEVDLGLIPVATIPLVPNALIISDFCIGAVGPVKTVLLMSKVPLEKISKVYLDTESRTSVKLAQVLASKLWFKDWEYAILPFDYISNPEIESMVLIGDKTQQKLPFPFQYDLAEAWQKLTGKPFVFAAWVANKSLSDEFISRFNVAIEKGLQRIPEAILKYDSGLNYDLESYLKNNISYPFDQDKKDALALFLELIKD